MLVAGESASGGEPTTYSLIKLPHYTITNVVAGESASGGEPTTYSLIKLPHYTITNIVAGEGFEPTTYGL